MPMRCQPLRCIGSSQEQSDHRSNQSEANQMPPAMVSTGPTQNNLPAALVPRPSGSTAVNHSQQNHSPPKSRAVARIVLIAFLIPDPPTADHFPLFGLVRKCMVNSAPHDAVTRKAKNISLLHLRSGLLRVSMMSIRRSSLPPQRSNQSEASHSAYRPLA